VLSLVIILVYSFAAMAAPGLDIQTNAKYENAWFISGITGALNIYPIAAWPYVGTTIPDLTSPEPVTTFL
jgi:hypothetical protein